MPNPFAVITDAASGIGLELARTAAHQGYDLLLVSRDPAIQAVVGDLQYEGIYVEALDLDPGAAGGAEQVLAAAEGKQVDLLCIVVGHEADEPFLERDSDDWHHGIDIDLGATLHLIQRVVGDMARRGAGKVLVTRPAPVASTCDALTRATNAFLETFMAALREEAGQHGDLVLTALMPSAWRSETALAREAWHALHGEVVAP